MKRSLKMSAFMVLFTAFLISGCASGSTHKNFPDILNRLDPKALASISSPSRSRVNGFFISYNGCLITTRHFKNFSAKDKFTIWNGSWHTARVVFEYQPWDLVVLKTDSHFSKVSVSKVPIPNLYLVPEMGETVYAIARNSVGDFKYITGTIISINKNLYAFSLDGEIISFPNTFSFWSDTAAQRGWSGSYVISNSGSVGYLLASDLKHISYFRQISYEDLNLIFPNLMNICH